MANKAPGRANDYLYIIAAETGKFYRLSKEDIEQDAREITAASDPEVHGALTKMNTEVGILADIPDSPPPTRSCICIALNLNYDGFKKSMNEKRDRWGK